MVLSVAVHVSPLPAGVVSLSGETWSIEGTSPLVEIKRYTGPVLLLGSADDIYVDAAGTR
jgi:hypothetical protein